LLGRRSSGAPRPDEGVAVGVGGRWRRLARRNSLAAFAGGVVAVMLLASLLAPWLAPYDPNGVDLSRRLQPPSARHWFGTDEVGRAAGAGPGPRLAGAGVCGGGGRAGRAGPSDSQRSPSPQQLGAGGGSGHA